MNKLYKYSEFLNESKMEKKTINAKDMFIPKDIIEIYELFNKHGKKLYIVGGAPRDYLQGKTPKDFDLVTDAMPDESKEILRGWERGNVSNDEQGQNFGVLRIYTDLEPNGHELATYRKDIAKGRDVKGDDQKVEIGEHVTIYDDVLRRDLTINAMFYDVHTKKIIDYVGGLKDLKNGIIRTVGEPYERFDEDRLRILRLFRFCARTGGKISEEVKNALTMDHRLHGISNEDDVSFERIFDTKNGEWNKMLGHAIEANDMSMFMNYLRLLDEYNMFDEIFPGIEIEVPWVNFPLFDNRIILPILMYQELNGSNSNLTEKLINCKLQNNLIDNIIFLFNYEKKITEESTGNVWIADIYQLAKNKIRFKIEDDILRSYSKSQGLYPEITEAFIKYCNDGFLKNSQELMQKGFHGKQLGQEIRRIEFERFKNEYLRHDN